MTTTPAGIPFGCKAAGAPPFVLTGARGACSLPGKKGGIVRPAPHAPELRSCPSAPSEIANLKSEMAVSHRRPIRSFSYRRHPARSLAGAPPLARNLKVGVRRTFNFWLSTLDFIPLSPFRMNTYKGNNILD